MRVGILFLALLVCGAGPSLAAAKPLPKTYGYGRAAGTPAPLLDLRGRVPAGPNAELAAGERKVTFQPVPPAWTPVQPPIVSCTATGREDGLTASGEAYDGAALAAAHPDMELSSLALVRNSQTGKEVIVRVNDRPRRNGAVEFTPAAASALGISDTCTAAVTVTRLGAAPYAAKAKPSPQPALAGQAPRLTPTDGAYRVQIGAFAQRDNAEAAREQVATAGPVSVEPALVGGTSLFRVRLGPWATRDEAEQARAAAAGLGFPNAKLLLP